MTKESAVPFGRYFRDTRYMARREAVTELLDAARRFAFTPPTLADLRDAQLALRACMARLDELNRPDELNGAS